MYDVYPATREPLCGAGAYLPPSPRLRELNLGYQACKASSLTAEPSPRPVLGCMSHNVLKLASHGWFQSCVTMCNYAPGLIPFQVDGDLSISGINSWKENYRVKACASRFCGRLVSSEQHWLSKTSLAFSLAGSREALAVRAASGARWPQGVPETWRAELEGQAALSGYRLSKSRKLGSG